MYKVSIEHLKAFKDALVKSTLALKIISETDDSPRILGAIRDNEKQIEIITTKFYIK